MEQDALNLLQILFFRLYKDKPNAILKVSCRYLSGGGPDKILGNFCLERKKVSYLLLFSYLFDSYPSHDLELAI
jgi:hypothetical protein